MRWELKLHSFRRNVKMQALDVQKITMSFPFIIQVEGS